MGAVVSEVGSRARRPELREFLRSRRARITPEMAGLPAAPRRRGQGLRQEEVAVLAGVGASWYQWLEQGRDIVVSAQVLDAVARVLRLDSAERRHLYALAELNPPPPDPAPRPEYCEGLQRLIEAWEPRPATVLDRYWNHVAWNESARLSLGLEGADRNCLVGFFRQRAQRRGAASLAAWERVAPLVVAAFRAAAADHPGDPGFAEVVAELRRTSGEFAQLWARQEVRELAAVVNEVEHPVVGTLTFESTQLRMPAQPGITLVLYNPVEGTETAQKVRWLLSEE
ncbi:transcriptional regulator [Kitasatospora phosalacinea]|uniref:Transcriptional regulator n=1 Tax=Kitasatospora phosalacinea TaxID=2065 RepID=A0A9W6Q973_9ACTN|nr:helix-turn-helix transcriptional regulator [Kitasatospora phosalacinea]GLW70776.1 transcriptional regulator [Kitasatospora phosalacinea]